MSDHQAPTDLVETRSSLNPFVLVRRLQAWVEGLADGRNAAWTLFLMAVAESIFFPIPVDVLLIALCVSLPRKSFRFAAICTTGSVLGGFFGYQIGSFLWYDSAGQFSRLAVFFLDVIPGFTESTFESVQVLYREYDFLAVFAAGFTPLPYKVFTITAGVFDISLPVFLIASLVSRAGRFFLVAALFHFFGAPIKRFIDKYLEILSIAFLILLVAGFVLLKYVL
ncbi:MAG TPA: DedA family protein [Rhodothermia bacterium]|nr:DedA family protein [Rhodothermia bacterium]